ncbi:hypothetical protein FBU59_000574 [Linderina macrospora]|uniref:Uncharacterized protein n=1 Tax=Linderina macrospora TaxID=4868 RepID=A0ACC1JGA0_9FUNG|nr:hypothetical protein FBU59_000574 [Linderina macrospora]
MVAARSVAHYYVKGPKSERWSLKFHIKRDIYYYGGKYLSEKPLTEDAIHLLNVQDFAAKLRKTDLPHTTIPAELGTYVESSFAVSDIEIDPTKFAGIGGVAEKRLVEMAQNDKTSHGRSRIQFDLIVSNLAQTELAKHGVRSQDMLEIKPVLARERIVLYLHGGGYMYGSPASHRKHVANMAAMTGARTMVIDYRLAPLNLFPAQLLDALYSFLYLLDQGFRQEDIILAGESAGGNLVLVLALLLRHMGIGNVRGLVLISPWVDLSCTCRSAVENTKFDYLSMPVVEFPQNPGRMFFAPGRKLTEDLVAELRHPLVSPLYGDFSNFPPTLIQAGTREVLYDDIVQLSEKIVSQNTHDTTNVVFEAYDDMVHVFQQFEELPDTEVAFASIGKFVRSL